MKHYDDVAMHRSTDGMVGGVPVCVTGMLTHVIIAVSKHASYVTRHQVLFEIETATGHNIQAYRKAVVAPWGK